MRQIESKIAEKEDFHDKKGLLKAFHSTFCYNEESKRTMRNIESEYFNELFQKMHGTDFFPDDYRYEKIEEIIQAITFDYAIDFEQDLNELDDIKHEIIGGLVSVYNKDRTQWLASHLQRADYVDQAQDYGIFSESANIFDRLGAGMYIEIAELFTNIVNTIEEEAKDFEEIESEV